MMKRQPIAIQARKALRLRFNEIGPTARLTVPVRGWIRALRQALGMSSAQLAKRLHIKQPSVIAIEQSEEKGTIQLATLRRVAEALDCTLVYALVPNQPLETMVRNRARAVARQRAAALDHTMLLEDQAVPPGNTEAEVDELLRQISPARLWDEV